MVNGRQKGAAAEREIIALLQHAVAIALPTVTCELRRNLEQYQNGGADVTGMPPEFDTLAIEVKRCEKQEVAKWWRQTVAQAERNKKQPVLIYRSSRTDWTVATEVGVHACANGVYQAVVAMNLPDFLKWYILELEGLALNQDKERSPNNES